MCGIVGVMTEKLGLGDYLKLKDLMVLAQLRGDEGAGLMAVPKKNPVTEVRVRKTTWSSGHLVTTSDFDEAIKGDCSIVVGHARQPTKGGTKIAAVHPHRSGKIILVHNGTMSHVCGDQVKKDDSDSMMIAKALETQGLKKFVNDSYGAYCLVWVDMEDQSLNFIRNSERPLSLCWERVHTISDVRSHLWFASEMWMVQMALGRCSGYNKDRHEYLALPINEHWKFPLSVSHNIIDPVVEKVEKQYRSAIGWYNDGFDEDWAVGGGTQRPPLAIASSDGSNVSYIAQNGKQSGTTNGFKYTPPEYRQPTLSPVSVLRRSAQDAALATAAAERKGSSSQTSMFPDGTNQKDRAQVYTSIEDYRCRDHHQTLELIRNAPCVWCEGYPDTLGASTPRVYPVRFTTSRGEYVCDDCILDKDVQRMVGIG